MIIGVPKEIKKNENRVGMTPIGVAELVHHGHTVVVQHTAGENSGFSDEEYVQAGARILPSRLRKSHPVRPATSRFTRSGRRTHIRSHT